MQKEHKTSSLIYEYLHMQRRKRISDIVERRTQQPQTKSIEIDRNKSIKNKNDPPCLSMCTLPSFPYF